MWLKRLGSGQASDLDHPDRIPECRRPGSGGRSRSPSCPGQNATGFSDILAELSGKLVDVTREMIKPHRIVHYLWHTAWPDGQNRYQATEEAVRAAGMQLQPKGIAEISELDAAVAAIKLSGSPAFIVQPSPFTYGHRDRIIASAKKNGLGDNSCLAGCSQRRGRVGWIRSRLRSHVQSSAF